MDFRFKFRRKPASPEEAEQEQRVSRDLLTRMRGLAIGLSIPLGLVAGPLAGWLIGTMLDRALGTRLPGWFVPLGLVAILAATLYGPGGEPQQPEEEEAREELAGDGEV